MNNAWINISHLKCWNKQRWYPIYTCEIHIQWNSWSTSYMDTWWNVHYCWHMIIWKGNEAADSNAFTLYECTCHAYPPGFTFFLFTILRCNWLHVNFSMGYYLSKLDYLSFNVTTFMGNYQYMIHEMAEWHDPLRRWTK